MRVVSLAAKGPDPARDLEDTKYEPGPVFGWGESGSTGRSLIAPLAQHEPKRQCQVMNSWCEKTKSPALVFPKPEPKRPTARNATAVTGGGAKAQAYEAQRTTLTAQGGGSGQAVPVPMIVLTATAATT